jgi:hypothetical protein
VRQLLAAGEAAALQAVPLQDRRRTWGEGR